MMSDVIVCLTFDLGAESKQVRECEEPVSISKGQFGVRRGMPRILSLLKRHAIPGTFFTSGWAADRYPDVMKQISASNHEIASHGYLHEHLDTLSIYEEQFVHEKATKSLEVFGAPVKGLRAPYWAISWNTLQLITEANYLYDSSLMNDDRPYVMPVPGTTKKLVEFPVEWFLDDYPLFEQLRQPPSMVLETWKAQFDEFLKMEDLHDDHQVFTWTGHPYVTGHAYRLRVLDQFIEYVKAHGGEFSRMGDVAERILANDG